MIRLYGRVRAPWQECRGEFSRWAAHGGHIHGLVVVLSLIPVEVDLSEGRDKWSHFLAYGGLMFWFGLLFSKPIGRLRIALGLIAMGVALEFLQRETGYRSFDVLDMAANSVGVLLGWVLVRTPLGSLFPGLRDR